MLSSEQKCTSTNTKASLVDLNHKLNMDFDL